MLGGLDLAPPEFPLNNAAAEKSSLSGLSPDFKFGICEQSSLELISFRKTSNSPSTSHSYDSDIERVISNLIVSGSLFITIDIKTGPYCLLSISRDFKFITVDSTLSSNSLLFFISLMLLTGDMESNWSILEVIRIYLLPKRFCRSSTASR